MKIFISWSGKRSKAMAIGLKEWIPLVLQYANPWVSDKDIGAGDRWAQAIAGELESSNFGILCITPENLRSEWILFEAGALSKSMLDAKVIPLLFDLELSDLSGPLSQFQAQKVDQSGLLDVVKSINAVSELKASDGVIAQLVPALWPQLEKMLASIPDKEPTEKHMRPQTEILEDLVTQVRGLSTRVREFDPEVMDREYRYMGGRFRDMDVRLLNELLHLLPASSDFDASLLMVAGIVRDRAPWLAEVIVEAHRDLKSASPSRAQEIGANLKRFVEYTILGPMGEKFFGGSKSTYMLFREIPYLVDLCVSNRIGEMKSSDMSDSNNTGEFSETKGRVRPRLPRA